MTFPSVFQLSSIDGTNGYNITGGQQYSGFGTAIAGGGDFNGDGYADIIIGAYATDVSTSTQTFADAGETYLLLGGPSDDMANRSVLDITPFTGAVFTGVAAGSKSGYSVDFAGDVNDDGFDDLLITALGDSSAYIVYGSSYPIYGTYSLSSAPVKITGPSTFGYSASGAGDVNGDGRDDIIVGAWDVDGAAYNAIGSAYVIFGGGTNVGTISTGSLNGANGFRFYLDEQYNTRLGLVVSAAGDVNGDGYADVMAGIQNYDANGNSSVGRAYVVFGGPSFSGTFDLAGINGSNGFFIQGIEAYDEVGYSMSELGDVNGDGIDDIIIGTSGVTHSGQSGYGESYVIFGKTTGFSAQISIASLDGTNGFVIRSPVLNDLVCTSVSAAGDVNGDGINDIAVSAGYKYAGGAGGVGNEGYIIFGTDAGFPALFDLSTIDGTNGFAIDSGDAIPFHPTIGVGDTDGDGYGDVLMSGSVPGVIYSPGPGNPPIEGTTGDDPDLQGTEGDDVINGLAGNDTIDALGGDDTINGGPGADAIDGGTGSDTASYEGSAQGVNVQLQYGIAQGGDAAGDTLTSIENLIGSDHNDTLFGNPGINVIHGRGGNDIIKGLANADQLYGEDGDDWVYVDNPDTVATGDAGTDRLFVLGNLGVTNAVGVNGFEIATGNVGDDTFDGTGATANLTLRGLSGNDVLTGGSGDDYIYGGAGADELRGGDGLDRLFIDETDTVIDGGAGTADRVLVQQLASATTGVSVDMAASHVEVAYGNLKNDTFDGSGSSDALSLYGRGGADTLIGGSANDRLYGDNGTNVGDVLNGGGGNDYLYGGTNTGGWAERDQFVFDADWGADRIFDFADNGAEKIDFSSIAGITQRADLTITDGSGFALVSYHDTAGNWDASIRVDGLTAAQLQDNDFIFV